MRIGRLRKRIKILKPTTSKDDHNQDIETFDVFREVWAGLNDKHRGEVELADQTVAKYSREFEIRYTPEVQENWRIEYKGEIYHINQLNELRGENRLRITAYKKDNV